MTILVVNLGQILKTRPMKTLTAFNELGISYAKLLWHLRPLSKIIDRYKEGTIRTETFRNRCKRQLSIKKSVSDEKFDEVWNAMTIVDDEAIEHLKTIAQLKKAGVTVVLTSQTNPLHIQKIEKELQGRVELDFMKDLFTSYQQRALKKSFWRKAHKHINKIKEKDEKVFKVISKIQTPTPFHWQWQDLTVLPLISKTTKWLWDHYLYRKACAEEHLKQEKDQKLGIGHLVWDREDTLDNVILNQLTQDEKNRFLGLCGQKEIPQSVTVLTHIHNRLKNHPPSTKPITLTPPSDKKKKMI